MLVEEQIQARQERAKEAIKRIVERPRGKPYGDYRVLSTSGGEYRVAMRGPGLFDNYCTCPDFARNTLGTCKHIESILNRLRNRYRSKLAQRSYERTRASLSLLYGEQLDVRLRLPDTPDPELRRISDQYFDASGRLLADAYPLFDRVLGELRAADGAAVIYSDVLDHVDRVNELNSGLEWEAEQLRSLEAGKAILQDLVNVPLFPYQVRGVLFAASRGRVVLADDMGLGKTVQAIAAATLLKRRHGIEKVLVISPASVKYQWKTEIEKFTALPVQVIDSDKRIRTRRYREPAFFNLINYELVRYDMLEIQALAPDLVILDEAQRIRNWTTKTARSVKQIKSRYAFVLTGTPLENKLEELYSVVEFVDGRALGPAFRFLHEHVELSETGKLVGYKGLHQLHEQLKPVLIRRKRDEVLHELPSRTDQIFRVPLTQAQAEPYAEQNEILGRLMHKWQRQGWLSEVDLRRITCCLQNMRMLCNSTFLFDKETNESPKLEEFREVVRELAIVENRKIVVFSEYERMTRLAGKELEQLGIEYVSLHGMVPSHKRGALMDRFRTDPECMVFLSTDAGGVGLNLQSASAVINFEPPWNPARLEQRIGRVHRMGQTQPVQVIHMLTENSIEERVWETMRLKKELFVGLFDDAADSVSFEHLGRSNMLKVVEEVMADMMPEDSKAEVVAGDLEADETGHGPDEAAESEGTHTDDLSGPDVPEQPSGQDSPPPKSEPPSPPGQVDLGEALAGLITAGTRVLESLTVPPAVPGESPAHAARDRQPPDLSGIVSGLVRTDPQTKRNVLAIPLPADLDTDRIGRAVSGLLAGLSRGR